MSRGPGQIQRDIIAVLRSMPSQASMKRLGQSYDWMTWMPASGLAKSVIPRDRWQRANVMTGLIIAEGPSAADQSAVRRALRSLEDRGLIEVQREPGRNLVRLKQSARGRARQLASGASKRVRLELAIR